MSSASHHSNHPMGGLSPLNEQQSSLLQQTISQLSPTQLAWVSGYLWGIGQSPSRPLNVEEAVPSATPSHILTIIYGSQTGNAKGVAESLTRAAKAENIPVRLVNADEYKAKQLAKETYVILVSSTHGEGEPPENIQGLYEFLLSKKAPDLSGLHYGVVGLGDSSYEYFCQTGKDLDGLLTKLGASAFVERFDGDVDYEQAIADWQSRALTAVKTAFAQTKSNEVNPKLAQSVATYDKYHPYTATLLTNQKITGRDSGKDVRHIEIDLNDSGIQYQPGDALGVWYENSPELVDDILAAVGLSGTESVSVDEQTLPVKAALIQYFEVTSANPPLVTQVAQRSQSAAMVLLRDNQDALREYAATTQILDVFRAANILLNAEELIGLLRRLTPRLYSIASSQAEVEEEVHLTVGIVEYEQNGEKRLGGASGFLGRRLEEGGSVNVFVEPNPNFRLPQDDHIPIIMVGPGTGIAPFRSFVQERALRQASGKNWLFFGDRTFTQDFLYQAEWQTYLKSGVLTKMDVAFSRDQSEKHYVQHRLLEQAESIWQWLQEGAYFYVCGDAVHMAKDVHEALLTIVQRQGKLTTEQATEYVNELRKAKRYQKDVY